MLSKSRKKLIEAGFSIYKADRKARIIARCTPRGGWSRIGMYTTLKQLDSAFAIILEGPFAIDD